MPIASGGTKPISNIAHTLSRVSNVIGTCQQQQQKKETKNTIKLNL